MSWSCDVLWESSSWTFCQSQPHQLCILWKHKLYRIQSIADSWTHRKPYILSSPISLRHKTLKSSLKPTASSCKIPKFDGYASILAVSQDTAVFQKRKRPPWHDILPHNWPFFFIHLILLRIILLTWTAFEAYLNVRLIQGRSVISHLRKWMVYMFECIPASQFGLSILGCAFPLPVHAMVPTFAFSATIIVCKIKNFHLLGFPTSTY